MASSIANPAVPFHPVWGIRVDALSTAFAAMTAFVVTALQRHCLRSLRTDAGLRRVMWLSSGLAFGLMALILAPNLFQFWVGAGISGAATYLLANHRRDTITAVAAARRTAVLQRIADLSLLLAIVFVIVKFAAYISGNVQFFPVSTPGSDADPLNFGNLDKLMPTAVHLVTGVGGRTMVVLAVLLLVTAGIRLMQVPTTWWSVQAEEMPIPLLGLVVIGALLSGGLLIARLYSLYLVAPHMRATLALLGAATAVIAGAAALSQRDLVRVGVYATAAEAGVVTATFGLGGYAAGLYLLFTLIPLTAIFFMAAHNVVRGYRSRLLTHHGGMRRTMPATAFALAVWAAGLSGLTVNVYWALATAFANSAPDATQLGSTSRTLTVIGLIAGVVLLGLGAWRCVAMVVTGAPERRRGFDHERIGDIAVDIRRNLLAVVAAVAAVSLIGFPGISLSGGIHHPTWSHFIYFGPVNAQRFLPDGTAVVIAALLLVLTAAGGWLLFTPQRRAAVHRASAPLRPLRDALIADLHAHRATALLARALDRAGHIFSVNDQALVEVVYHSAGEGVELLASGLARGRSRRPGTAIAISTLAVIALATMVLLAVNGHFPVRLR